MAALRPSPCPRRGPRAEASTSGTTTGGHEGLRASWSSPNPFWQELGEVAHPAELELLDGTFAAAEDVGRLGDAHPLEEPHDQAVLLLRGQLGQRLEEHL